MKVNGTATLNAPLPRVWEALNDPAVLAQTIPGCEQLEEVAENRYRMTVTAGVASIRGSFDGDVALIDQKYPESFVLRARGSGGPGTVSADVLVSLQEVADGATLLTYEADAVVGGTIGGVGQRMLSGVARKTAGQFFGAVDDHLAGRAKAAIPGHGARDAVLDSSGAAALSGDAIGSRVFRAASGARGAGVPVESPLVGIIVGAAVALAGVLVASRALRRRP